MNDLISVIVPIYNVKPYLTECVDSILNQTCKNLEIILVDDGSTDGSSEVCDDYAEKEKRIKVIHQENSGLTVTRRAGVNLAQGKYIGFVDGDDWIEENMYQTLHDYMQKENVDIVTSKCYREYPWGTGDGVLGDTIPTGNYQINEKEDYIITHLFPGLYEKAEYINGSLCFKLFKVEIIKSVLNEMDKRVHGFMDDTVCVVGAIIKSKSIMISSDVLYHHRERKDSFTYARNPLGLLQVNYGYLALKKILESSVYKEKIRGDLEEFVSKSTIAALNNLFEGDEYKIPQYFFRSKTIPISSKVLIYGAGKVGQSYWKQLKIEDKYHLLGIIDKNASEIENLGVIFTPDQMIDFKFDFIIIAIQDMRLAMEIKQQLIQKDIAPQKIIWELPCSIFEYFHL